MPGTIQVSVLDIIGLHSSSPPSQMSIKVSMGKREYQTWDKGDFSFPLTSLRDNLIVKLLDAEGNEMSHTAGVEMRLVVEKGLWDDIFPLEGGGHVHMKLQFVLSEEERDQIRAMRYSALRKKHSELLNSDLRSQENATNIGSNVASSLCCNNEISDSQRSLLQSEATATHAGLVPTSDNFFKNAKSSTEDGEGTHSVQKQMTPNNTDIYEETPSTIPVSVGFDSHLSQVSQRDLVEKIKTQTAPIDVPVRAVLGSSESLVTAKHNLTSPKLDEKQSPLEKTPSSVRNMISAFESGLAQDVRPHIRPPSQSSKIGTEAPLNNSNVTDKLKSEEVISGMATDSFLRTEVQQTPTHNRKIGGQIGFVRTFYGATTSQDTGQLELSASHIQTKGTNADLKNAFKVIYKEVDMKEDNKSSEDLMRVSTCETATVSGRMLDEHLSRHQLVNKRHSGGNLVRREKGKGIYLNDLLEVNTQGSSNDAVKSVEYWEKEHYSLECSGAWIFPDEARRLCVTTAGKQVMHSMGGCWDEAKTHLGNISSSVPENVEECGVHGGPDTKVNELENTSQKLRKSKLESSADPEDSRGAVGQVMRVAIMVGFATLVFLTRERKNRFLIASNKQHNTRTYLLDKVNLKTR